MRLDYLLRAKERREREENAIFAGIALFILLGICVLFWAAGGFVVMLKFLGILFVAVVGLAGCILLMVWLLAWRHED